MDVIDIDYHGLYTITGGLTVFIVKVEWNE